MITHSGLSGPWLGLCPTLSQPRAPEESLCPFTLCRHLVGPRHSADHAPPDLEQAHEVPLATAPTLEVALTPEISLHGCDLPSAWGMKARLREVPRARCDLGQRGCGHPSIFFLFVIGSVTGRKPLLHPSTFPSVMVFSPGPLRVPGELLELQ